MNRIIQLNEYWGPKTPKTPMKNAQFNPIETPCSKPLELSIAPPPIKRQPKINSINHSYEEWCTYHNAACVIQAYRRGNGSRQRATYVRLLRNNQAKFIQNRTRLFLWKPESRLVRKLEDEFNAVRNN